MRKRAAIAGLPAGVGVTHGVNGRGERYFKLRIGKRYTGGKPITKSFVTLKALKEWLLGPEFRETRGPSLNILSVIDENRGQFNAAEETFWTPDRLTATADVIRRLEKEGITLETAADFAIKHLRPDSELLPWDDAIEGALKEQSANRPSHGAECGKRWRRLKRWAVANKVDNLNGFTEVLARQYMREKPHLKPTAKRREISYMSILFSWAVNADKLNLNPWAPLMQQTKGRTKKKKHTLEDESVGRVRIFSIDELTSVFGLAKRGFTLSAPAEGEDSEKREKFHRKYGAKSVTVKPWELIPWLALGTFGGLRPEEAERVVWETYDLNSSEKITEINFAEKQLDLPAFKSKTGDARTWPMEPVLAAWLKPCKKESGSILPPNFQRKLWALRDSMGWNEWPQDITRHSYASYHLAFYKKAHETAHNLGHRDSRMLYAHYKRSLKKPAEAKAFWAAVPDKTQ